MHTLEEVDSLLRHSTNPQGNGGTYKLERMRNIMEALGNPQETLQVIHVAGTSGKTSTAYYLASLLKESGFKVGLTVSPHVLGVNERVQVNLTPLSSDDFYNELRVFIQQLEKHINLQPTYFEMLVAFSFWYFAKQKVDYAVVEVGLGGLLDGTNVIQRRDKVCVLTDIGFDHTNILGNTLSKIAFQKAGIIHAGNQVFCYEQSSDIMNVIRKTAGAEAAHLTVFTTQRQYSGLPLFQQRNFSLAEQVIEQTLKRKINGTDVSSRSQRVTIPGRMEIYTHGNKHIILDGAHNPQKLETLYDSINHMFPSQKITTVLSMSEREAAQLDESFKIVSRFSSAIVITSFSQKQDLPRMSVQAHQLIRSGNSDSKPRIQPSPKLAVRDALHIDNDIVLVTGSLYLVAEVKPLLEKLL